MAPFMPSMCASCLQSSKANNVVLPLWKGNKFFCSVSCLLDFKRYLFCGLCGAETYSSKRKLSNRVKVDFMRKAFCTKDCFGLFMKHVALVTTLPEGSQLEILRESKPFAQVKEEESNVFCWEKYLARTGSTAAPHRCFNQSEILLTNEFVVGMKLESRDPRNSNSYCIATVIATLGPRIRLRLDGSDNLSDFWRLVDDDTIKPIGYCESLGKNLQAPLGFQKDHSYWVTFMVKTMDGANLAPKECFKPKPSRPDSNFFRVGEKLEAMDRKNPHLICPASIVSFEKNDVEIRFDGWGGAFGYRCRYDSRDLFPIGWCEKNDHPLLPPGKTFKKKH